EEGCGAEDIHSNDDFCEVCFFSSCFCTMQATSKISPNAKTTIPPYKKAFFLLSVLMTSVKMNCATIRKTPSNISTHAKKVKTYRTFFSFIFHRPFVAVAPQV